MIPDLTPEEEEDVLLPTVASKVPQDTDTTQVEVMPMVKQDQKSSAPSGSPTKELSRSQRNRRPPAYMKDFVK